MPEDIPGPGVTERTQQLNAIILKNGKNTRKFYFFKYSKRIAYKQGISEGLICNNLNNKGLKSSLLL